MRIWVRTSSIRVYFECMYYTVYTAYKVLSISRLLYMYIALIQTLSLILSLSLYFYSFYFSMLFSVLLFRLPSHISIYLCMKRIFVNSRNEK